MHILIKRTYAKVKEDVNKYEVEEVGEDDEEHSYFLLQWK